MLPGRHLIFLTGASRGLGAAMAAHLLLPKNDLVCIARSSNAALTEMAEHRGASLEQWTMDLADGAAVAQRLSQCLATQDGTHFGQATLINNAGVISGLVPLRDADTADLSRALRVGLEAPLLLCAAFLAGTRNWSGSRKVLNISSGLGRRAMAASSAYCAAKAGMDHFSRCMALEEASQPNGAKICALAPGVIDTSMQDQLRAADPAKFPDHAAFEGLHTQGQLSSADVAARKVLAFLARPDFGQDAVADVRG